MLLIDLRNCLYDQHGKLLDGRKGFHALATRLCSEHLKVGLANNNLSGFQLNSAGNAVSRLCSENPDYTVALSEVADFLTKRYEPEAELNFTELNTLISLLTIVGVSIQDIDVEVVRNFYGRPR